MASPAPAARKLLFPPGDDLGPSSRRALRGLAAGALDLLYPPHCASCGQPLPPRTNLILCWSCAERVSWIGTDRCERCGDATGQGSGLAHDCYSCRTYPPRFVTKTCAIVKYADGPIRDLILGLKFGRKLHLARALGELLAQRIQDCDLLRADEPGREFILVPAPIHRSSAMQRGFNQAQELAARAAARLGLKLETRLLKKIRRTPPQATLSHEKRRVNLAGAFACSPRRAARYQRTSVLLIDDVMTTGSTLSECARTLAAAGIKEIHAAVVARG